MKRSTDRILVTHAGALPRPDVRDLVTARADAIGGARFATQQL